MGTEQLDRKGGTLSKKGGFEVALFGLVLVALASVLLLTLQNASSPSGLGHRGSPGIVELP